MKNKFAMRVLSALASVGMLPTQQVPRLVYLNRKPKFTDQELEFIRSRTTKAERKQAVRDTKAAYYARAAQGEST